MSSPFAKPFTPARFQCRASVKLGEHNLTSSIDCEGELCADPPQIIRPMRVFVPTEYEDEAFVHDLALIELANPANITQHVTPICLPEMQMRRKNLMNETVEVGGWGTFDIDEPGTNSILQFVRLKVVPLELCKRIEQFKGKNFTEAQMCVGGRQGFDSCNGKWRVGGS